MVTIRPDVFFITVEGCEGCGKSTQSVLLKKYLENKGFKVILTREPGGSIVAEQVRNILLNPKLKISPLCELMLYEAARVQHMEDIIYPNLKNGFVVICDRFTDSTVAYQGYARRIDIETIEKLNNIATSGLKPDLTFYLDVDPAVGIERARAKKCFDNGDRIEREDIDFHNAVRNGFLELSEKYPDRIKKIEITDTIESTQKLINTEMDKFLSGKK